MSSKLTLIVQLNDIGVDATSIFTLIEHNKRPISSGIEDVLITRRLQKILKHRFLSHKTLDLRGDVRAS
jgi:hypothetical protein